MTTGAPERGASQGCLKVPGTKAPVISVPGLGNSMWRRVLNSKGDFASFLSCLTCPPGTSISASPSVWPVPLPFPEVFHGLSGGASAWRKRCVNLAIAAMNWLYLSRPSRAPPGLEAGRPLSKRQWAMVKLLERYLDGCDFLTFEPPDLGRTAPKLEDQDHILGNIWKEVASAQSASGYFGTSFQPSGQQEGGDDDPVAGPLAERLSKDFGTQCGKLSGEKAMNAKSIEASRISMPPAPSFDPRPYLDAKTRAVYEHPIEHRLPEPREPPPPRSSIMASSENKLLLLKQLATTGRLGVLERHEVTPGISSGLFAVIKDMERDRLILDGRGANVYEMPLNAWTKCLASADKVAGIYLPPGVGLSCSGRDLKDFFYQFRVGRERMARNCLSGALSQGDMDFIFGEGKVKVRGSAHVGLNTLAMGDCSACEYAQASHLCLLYERGVFAENELITLSSPVPRTEILAGVIIDDLIVLELLPLGLCTSPRPWPQTGSDLRMALADLAYAGANLLTNSKKAFQNEMNGRFWGIELDGIQGLVRPARSRVWPLIAITSRVISLGFATVGLMKVLCGSWISVLLLRRRLLSIMDLIFAAAGLEDQSTIVRLSGKLKSELWCLVALGPFAVADLRAKPASFISATDASSWGGAGVRAKVPSTLVLECCRHSLAKGTWTKLLPPAKAWMYERGQLSADDELQSEDPYPPNQLANVLASCPLYQEQWKRGFKQGEHINCKEVRAYLLEEEFVSRTHQNIRTLCGLDSQVGLGALTKGRSASPSLNKLLSSSVGPYLGAGVVPHYMFFATDLNPADGPTRGKPPPPPKSLFPAWWEPATRGDFGELDKFLSKRAAQGEGPSFDHIRQAEVPCVSGGRGEAERCDCRPQSSLRAERRLLQHLRTEAPFDDWGGASNLGSSGSFLGVPCSQVFTRGGRAPDSTAKGCLDLFCGTGGVTRALLRHGAAWVISFDLLRSPSEDLSVLSCQTLVEDLVREGKVAVVAMAPPGDSFSRAVTPSIRSQRYPLGLPSLGGQMLEKVRMGNDLALWCRKLSLLCEAARVTWWIEHPDTSWMWRLRPYRPFADPNSSRIWRCDMCQFATPWRKRTRVATSCELQGARTFCQCSLPHVVLRGRSAAHRQTWTAVAQP